MSDTTKLKVFLCHASEDKPRVRDLYKKMALENWIDVWLDEEKLLPGQKWKIEIPKAVRETNVVIVCLSTKSVTKEGYVQRELKYALDMALEKPDDAIFIVPLRLNDCIVPESIKELHWLNFFSDSDEVAAYEQLRRSLILRATSLGISTKVGHDQVVIIMVSVIYEGERELNQLWKILSEVGFLRVVTINHLSLIATQVAAGYFIKMRNDRNKIYDDTGGPIKSFPAEEKLDIYGNVIFQNQALFVGVGPYPSTKDPHRRPVLHIWGPAHQVKYLIEDILLKHKLSYASVESDLKSALLWWENSILFDKVPVYVALVAPE